MIRLLPIQIWNTTWGGTDLEAEGYGVAAVDGDVYIAGWIMSFEVEIPDAFLVKYDSDGNQLWNTTWGGTDYDRGYGVAAVNDDVYITGRTDSFGAGNGDAFLVKYDSDGNQLWNTTWGGTGWDDGYGVAAVADDVYIAGRTDSFGARIWDAFLVKYDSDGNQLWNATWRGMHDERGHGVAAVGDDVYIVGFTDSYGAGDSDAFLVKFDSDGNQLWNTTWGGTSRDKGREVTAVDGDVYITGYTVSFGAKSWDAFLVKYDTDGNQQWNTTWGALVWNHGLGVAAVGGDVYITGYVASHEMGSRDAFLVKYEQELEPFFSIYTDKYTYSEGDTLYLGLDLQNPGGSLSACLVIVLEKPGGGLKVISHAHAVTLPAGLVYSNPSFKTFTLPSIPPGTYTWHAVLLRSSDHKILVHDTADWEFI